MPSCSVSSNFMLNDFLCMSAASLLMPLFILIPGYVLGWLGNLFDFRQRRFVTRLLIGIVLSVAVFPALTYLLARLTSFDAALALHAVLWALFAWTLFRERGRFRFALDRWTRMAAILTLLWALAALLSLPDLQLDQRLYSNAVSNDHQTRIALTDSIFRTGIPPVNPHIYPGQPLPVSYFYFWYLFPALLSRLTGGWIDSRIAFYAGILWVGIALRAAACLYLRFQSPEGWQSIGPRSAAAVGLFFITGLDVLFAGLFVLLGAGSPFITEWWNGNSQVTAWSGASFWVPHHVAGLITGITGILVFQSLTPAMPRRKKALLTALTALSLASLIGLSLYVALIFVLFWGVYFVILLIIKARRRGLPWLAGAGVLAVLLALPFLGEMFASRASFSSGTEGQGTYFVFEVRQLGFLAGLTTGWPAGLKNLFNLLLLPLNYFLELGFFLAAGVFYLRAALRERGALLNRLGIDLLLLTCSGLFCSFFRSAIIGNNDVGWRGFMPVQFILLVWGASVLVSLWQGRSGAVQMPVVRAARRARGLLAGLLAIGLASTLFDLAYLRVFNVLDETGGWANPTFGVQISDWGRRNYAIREAFRFIYARYPRAAVVQNNPEVEAALRTQGLYGLRQTAAAGKEYSFIYGDPPEVYQGLSVDLLPIFLDTQKSWPEVSTACQDLQIDVLVVKDLDPVWRDAATWVWSEDPAFENDRVRVFSCP